MKIQIDSKITIQDISEEVLAYCNTHLFFPNPDVQKKKAMGFWTGNLQKNIKLYTKNGNNYIVPMGCLKDIWNLHPYKNDYSINFGQHKKIEYPKLKFSLFPYQKEAVEHMIKIKRGILQAPCGSGKSICAVEMIRKIGYKTLIIVQTMEILNQFKDYFLNVMGLPKEDIGIIAAGKVNIGSKITLALRQTLCNIDLLQYKYEWGCIVRG
jgi:superfamily II DNA or RNA helicase